MPFRLNTIFLRAIVLLVLFQAGDLAIFNLLKNGMDHYYGMDEQAEILCIGHSHTVLGIDAEVLEEKLGVPVAKYATAGANTLDRDWMLKQFIEEHPTVKTVVYDVDPRLFDSENLSSASYTLFFPYIENEAIGKYLKKEASWQEYYTSRWIRTARFRDQTINIAIRGILGKIENKKNGIIRIKDYENYIKREQYREIRINPESVQQFHDSIKYLTQKDITIFLVFIPVIDLLNNINPTKQKNIVNIFKETAFNNKNVLFLDYNQEYQHNYELFYDLRHLNNKGNTLITKRLVTDLQRTHILPFTPSQKSSQLQSSKSKQQVEN